MLIGYAEQNGLERWIILWEKYLVRFQGIEGICGFAGDGVGCLS